MENDLYIHKLAAAQVNIYTGAKKFFRQHGNIKTVGIKSCQITSFYIIGNSTGHFFEGRTICHILVIDAMNSRRTFGNMHFRIDTKCFCFLITIGVYFEITDFNDTVYIDTRSGRLQIKKNNRVFEV